MDKGIERVLVISDTHGRHKNLARVLEKIGRLDLIIHLGDMEGGEAFIRRMAPCPVEMIQGNNDYMTGMPKEKVLSFGKYRAFLVHGHRHHVYHTYDILISEAKERDCQIVMFGHTHVPEIQYAGNIIMINPGSLSFPRPITAKPSYILMDFDREGEVHFTINRLEEW